MCSASRPRLATQTIPKSSRDRSWSDEKIWPASLLADGPKASPLAAVASWPPTFDPGLGDPGLGQSSPLTRGPGDWSGPAAIVRGQDYDDALVTDRPDFTEASSVVGYRRLQIEGGYTYAHDKSDGIATDEHVLPELLMRYGLSDCVELRIGWVGYVSVTETVQATSTATNSSGGTGLDLGFKVKCTDQQGWMPESAVIFGVTAPIGDPEIDSDRVGASAVGAYSWELNDWLSIGGNTGFFSVPSDGDYFNLFAQSIAAGISLTDRLGMYQEWIMLVFDDAADSPTQHIYNGGFTFLVTPDLQLDWRAGIGLNEAADDFFTGVGFAVRR